MSGTVPLYELRAVGKRYGDGGVAVVALGQIDLEIGAGEFVAVVGASGSGKSTLLQLLGALDRPSEGRVAFEGRELGALSENELADLRRDEIGFVFQQFNLIPTLTAAENVEAAIAPTSASSAELTARAAELLERVGLAGRSDHLPGELSGGEQQRVAIARALANRPRVLLADEPTGNLDSSTGAGVLELIRSLHSDEGLTVVLVTHDESLAGEAGGLVRLSDGELAN